MNWLRWLGGGPGQRLMRNSAWRLLANLVALSISLVTFPIIAQTLGIEGYGRLAVVTSTVGLIGYVIGLRLWDAVVKYLAEFLTQNAFDRAWAILRLGYLLDIATSLLVFVIVGLTAPLAAEHLLHAPTLADLFVLGGLQSAAGMTSAISVAILRVLDQFRFLSWADIALAMVRSVLVLAIVLGGGGIAGVLIGYALAQAGWSVSLLWQASRLVRQRMTKAGEPTTRAHWWGPILEPLRGQLREIIAFLFNLNLDTYRKTVTANADILLLGYLAPASVVGAYKVARQLVGYVGQLGNPLYEVLYPEIAREWNGPGRLNLVRLLQRLSLTIGILYVLGLILGSLLARPLIVGVFGHAYVEAVPIFRILLLSTVWFIWLWLPGLMMTMGHAGTLVRLSLVNAIVSLALMVVLGVWYGAIGVAIGSAAGPFVGILPILWFLYKHRSEFDSQAVISGQGSTPG